MQPGMIFWPYLAQGFLALEQWPVGVILAIEEQQVERVIVQFSRLIFSERLLQGIE